MVAFGAIEIASFLIATAIVFVLVTLWILKSEVNRNIFRNELKKLRSQIESSEREKFLLAEEVDEIKSAEPAPEGSARLVKTIISKNENLEAENARLKKELDEAKGSLEEVYKALCEQQ